MWSFWVALCVREDRDVPTLWPCELPEGWQGDDGVGHSVDRIQNASDIVGRTGFYTANGVRTLHSCHSVGEDRQTKTQTHTSSDL